MVFNSNERIFFHSLGSKAYKFPSMNILFKLTRESSEKKFIETITTQKVI